MTEKKDKILESALELFAEKGYDSTSTSAVAKRAGVSEGLIFRHFENKDGLLKAILELGKEMAYAEYAGLFRKEDPKEVLRSILEFPFNLSTEHFPFWKLIYSIKWQADTYDPSVSAPMEEGLTGVFRELGYEDPEGEASLILVIIDGLATRFLLRGMEGKEQIKNSLLARYGF